MEQALPWWGLAQAGQPAELTAVLRGAGFASPACAASGAVAAARRGIVEAQVAALPDPASALVALDELERCGAEVGREEVEVLLRLGAQSGWLGMELARRAEVLRRWVAMGGEGLRARRSEEALRALLEAEVGQGAPFLVAVRRFRLAALARAFYREAWGLAPGRETTAEVSALASVCLDAVLADVRARTPGWPVDRAGAPIPFAVIGLGKLGGGELNFGSDVDLVYIYGTDEGVVPEGSGRSVHEAFVRVAQELTRALDEPGEGGRIWRVDMRLRPEGARGPLVHSAAALEAYYEAWGRTFERAVWLKARAVAGDRRLGAAVIERLTPFVYRRHLDYSALDELREMKDRIDRHARTVGARSVRLGMAAASSAPAGWPRGADELLGWDIKTGQGGIREIEFSVQALQLVYGGRQAALRERSTLGALERLLAAGLLPAADVDALATAYELYRLVEHRVQMDADRQTHALPQKLDAFALLARRMGAEPVAFAARLLEHRRRVGAIFARLLSARPDEAEAWRPGEAVQALLDLTDPAVEDAEHQELFRRAGFERPRQSIGQLIVLRSKPFSPFSPSADPKLRKVGARLLAEVCRSADPDTALVHLATFALRVGARRGLLDALGESPAAITVLATLFGSSRYFGDIFARRPELFDALLGDREAASPWEPSWLTAALEREIAGVEALEGRLSRMSAFKHRHELRVALADLAGEFDVADVGAELTALAEAILGRVVQEAWEELTERHGAPARADGSAVEFAVVGFGKLGGRELVYGSDLDLVFLYDGACATAGPRPLSGVEFFSKLVRRMIAFLSTSLGAGALYAVDTRLRPDGGHGTLVTSWETFSEYQRGRALPAESLALVRARVVWGGEGLRARFDALRHEVCFERWRGPAGAALVAAARELRPRLDRIVARGGLDLKVGRGGLLDAELVVQIAQMRQGAAEDALRGTSTLRTLRALAEVAVASTSVEALQDAWLLLRRVEMRLRLVEGRSDAVVPIDDPRALERLARRVGYRGEDAAERLARDLAAARREIVAAWEAMG